MGAREPDTVDAGHGAQVPEQVSEQRSRLSGTVSHPSLAGDPCQIGIFGCCAAPLRGQVATVGIHVLAEQRDLDGPAGRKAFELFDELAERPADLRAAHRRHDAEGARVVASDLNRDPGRMGLVVPHRHRRREVGLLVAARSLRHLEHRFAARARKAEKRCDPAEVVGAEDGVDMRRTLEQQLTVLLGEAASNGDLQTGAPLLDRLQLAEVPVQPVVGVLADAAGIEHDDVCLFQVVGSRHAVGCEHRGDALRVVLVHLAPEGTNQEPACLGHRKRLGPGAASRARSSRCAPSPHASCR